MPPVEQNGKQVELVDSADQPISVTAYLAHESARRSWAKNTILKSVLPWWQNRRWMKYPYNPFYDEFSPRIAVAWSPHFDSNSLQARSSARGYGHSRRLWPRLRPLERCGSGAGAVAGTGPPPARAMPHWP